MFLKKPSFGNHKRKLDSSRNPGISSKGYSAQQGMKLMGVDEIYKSAKLSANGTAKQDRQATAQEEEEPDVAGSELPPGEEDDQEPDDDEEGRFFGGGITKDTATVLDFIDERDQDDVAVSTLLKRAMRHELKSI